MFLKTSAKTGFTKFRWCNFDAEDTPGSRRPMPKLLSKISFLTTFKVSSKTGFEKFRSRNFDVEDETGSGPFSGRTVEDAPRDTAK
ncbi:hypothetical protein CEXT_424851 [Caerostris extrusa]|uniref:Uncharacterized protein n=1 Tax=Caerostris extrusa TaxID=172846 RepID=A0AAV4W8P6_CAEEX|nr:hypothetical protein CEXT_424851 [Caerostris extrusa]